ncbi:MAG: hypothetical protein ACKVQA_15305 [Burkholderiales bacterium]
MNSIAIPAPTLNPVPNKIHPLQALMQAWEKEDAEEPESETELMVMLSGMVGQQFFSLDGD